MTKNQLAQSFTITIPAAEFAQKQNEKLEGIRKEAKLPGFRPGQAPMNLIKSKYENAVKGESLDEMIQEKTEEYLTKNNIRPALRPKIEITTFEDGKDIEFKVELEKLPDIKPADLKTLEVTRIVTHASDADVEEAVTKLAGSRKTTEIVDEKRPTKKDDVVVIDFKGEIDGEAFAGGEGKDYYLALGSNTFIPGFEDQLIGKNIGDKTDVNVSFPEDYHAKNLAGKKAVFHVDVKELRRFKDPELNDEFAKVFGADSMDKLRELIKDELEKEYARVARMHTKRALLDVLAEAHSFEVPQGMVDLEFDSIWKQYEEAKKANQLDEEEKAKSEDELKAEYKAIAERRVRLGLLLAQIANDAKVTLDQQDVNNAILAEARRYPGQEKMVFEYYQKNPQAIDALRAPMFEEKVVDYVMTVIKTNDKEMTSKELYAYNPDEAAKPAKKAKATKAK